MRSIVNRALVNRTLSFGALAGILLAAGCGSNQGTGLLSLSISADPQIPDEAASRIVISSPGGSNHVYQGKFPPKDRSTLPLKLQVPNLTANDTPVTFTVQGFDASGCAVTTPATTAAVVIKAGAETELMSVTLGKSDTSCTDSGVPVDSADSGGGSAGAETVAGVDSTGTDAAIDTTDGSAMTADRSGPETADVVSDGRQTNDGAIEEPTDAFVPDSAADLSGRDTGTGGTDGTSDTAVSDADIAQWDAPTAGGAGGTSGTGGSAGTGVPANDGPPATGGTNDTGVSDADTAQWDAPTAGGAGGTSGTGGSAGTGVAANDGPPATGGTSDTGVSDADIAQRDAPTAGGAGGTSEAGGSAGTDAAASDGPPATGGSAASDAAMPLPLVTASDGSYTDKVQVSWTAATGATSYQVYRNTSSSSSGATQVGTPTASPYSDTTATPGAVYYYFVKACNSTICSDFSTPDSGYRSAAPPNDDFAGATPLGTVPFLSSIAATDATTAVDDPALTLCSQPAGTKSVWYSYTPSANRLVFLDTFGSNYDTMIGVFTGARGSLTAVACNDDDSRSPSGLNSAVEIDATAGTTYYIVVYSFAGAKSGGAAATTATLEFHATTFYDVPGNYPFWRYIEGFYAMGMTTGCGSTPFSYCPDNAATRADMAVFLLRAMHGGSYQPPPSTGVFPDLPVAGKEWMQPWVEEFYREGLTTGCGGDPMQFCPETPATRAVTAVYILRSTKGVSYQPPASTGVFADLPVAGKEWMQPWVEESYREGITTGCADNPLQYCPETSDTRGAVAAAISRAYSFTQLP